MSTPTRPQLWIVAGPNGAGKSTLVRRRIAGRLAVVNPDDIVLAIGRNLEEDISILRRAGKFALEQRQQHIAARRSFAIETTLTGKTELALMNQARLAGYKITLVYIGLRSVAHSRSRVALRARSGGHPVPLPDITRRFDRSLANLAPAIRLADRALVLDNSGGRLRLLLSLEHGRTRFISRRLPPWAQRAVPANLRRDRDDALSL